jgi:hypothetical protein
MCTGHDPGASGSPLIFGTWPARTAYHTSKISFLWQSHNLRVNVFSMETRACASIGWLRAEAEIMAALEREGCSSNTQVSIGDRCPRPLAAGGCVS